MEAASFCSASLADKRYSGQQVHAPEKLHKFSDKCYFIKIDLDLIGGKK